MIVNVIFCVWTIYPQNVLNLLLFFVNFNLVVLTKFALWQLELIKRFWVGSRYSPRDFPCSSINKHILTYTYTLGKLDLTSCTRAHQIDRGVFRTLSIIHDETFYETFNGFYLWIISLKSSLGVWQGAK